MSPIFTCLLFGLCYVALAERPAVEPEYLDMLRATGRDEEFAELMGIDVNLVRPKEGRSEGDFMFTSVSELGDILLSQEQEEQARQGVLFSKYPGSKWPNNRIPYSISTADYNIFQRTSIMNALNSLSSRTSKLRVVPRTTETDYVMVVSGEGCYSNLGRTGKQQIVSLQSNGCLSSGTIQHEFIHAAGFTHEHNRPDRDNYVTVLTKNIPAEWQSQYKKESADDFGNQDNYDPYSVMHYPLNAPGTNKPAFEFRDKSVDTSQVGQRNGPTDTDIRKIDILYP